MNLTLSLDKELLEKSREAAKRQHTSVNNLVREYLRNLVSETDAESAAVEFAEIARDSGGRSDEGWNFNRDVIYDRDRDR